MTKKFEWNRTHKIDEWVEREMIECVSEYVFEFYGVSDVSELTEDQIAEIENWRQEELNDYSPLQWGFSWLISTWESEDWEASENDT